MFDAPQIKLEKVKQHLDDGDAVIYDIRDPGSFAMGHIPGAIALNNQNLPEVLKTENKSSPVVIVCYHGNDSQSAALFFREQGFSTVHSMIGGMAAWRMAHPDLLET